MIVLAYGWCEFLGGLVIAILSAVIGVPVGICVYRLTERRMVRVDARAKIMEWIVKYQEIKDTGERLAGGILDQTATIHSDSITDMTSQILRSIETLKENKRGKTEDIWREYRELKPLDLPRHEFRSTPTFGETRQMYEALNAGRGVPNIQRPVSGRDVAIRLLREIYSGLS